MALARGTSLVGTGRRDGPDRHRRPFPLALPGDRGVRRQEIVSTTGSTARNNCAGGGCKRTRSFLRSEVRRARSAGRTKPLEDQHLDRQQPPLASTTYQQPALHRGGAQRRTCERDEATDRGARARGGQAELAIRPAIRLAAVAPGQAFERNSRQHQYVRRQPKPVASVLHFSERQLRFGFVYDELPAD